MNRLVTSPANVAPALSSGTQSVARVRRRLPAQLQANAIKAIPLPTSAVSVHSTDRLPSPRPRSPAPCFDVRTPTP